MSSERGSSRLSAYVYGVTDEQVAELTEAFADLLIERGFNAGDDMNCIVAASGFEWPDEAHGFVERFEDEGAALVIIPQPRRRA